MHHRTATATLVLRAPALLLLNGPPALCPLNTPVSPCGIAPTGQCLSLSRLWRGMDQARRMISNANRRVGSHVV